MKLNHDEKHYSISQINLYSLCPRKYQHQYVDKLPYTPIYNLESGKAAHAGLEKNNNDIKDKDAPMSYDKIMEVAVENFRDNNADRIEEADFELDEGIDKLVGDFTNPLKTYKDVHEDEFRYQGIVAVEEPFQIECSGEKVMGYIDLVTNDVIVDYKLLGRRKSQDQVNNDPQLVLYEEVSEKKGFFIEFIRKRARAELSQPLRTPSRARAILAWIEEQIKNIEKSKKIGHFPKIAPTGWLCKNCQYRFKCWEKKNK